MRYKAFLLCDTRYIVSQLAKKLRALIFYEVSRFVVLYITAILLRVSPTFTK